MPNATVEIVVDGESKKATAQGDGPVDAVFRAITELTDAKCELVQYQVKAITGGMDAQGEVTVTISDGGRRVIGHGAHTDILVASARAFVSALNKLEGQQKRRDQDAPRGI
jgi:2-isopropylmalate synthase